MSPLTKSKAPPAPDIPELPGILTGPAGLSAVFDILPLALVVTRLDGRGLLLANQAALKLFEIRREDLAKLAVTDFYAEPADREQVIGILRQKGAVDDYELQLKSTSGRIVWTRISARLMRHEQQLVLLVAMQTVNERKAAELRIEQLLGEIRQANAGLEHQVEERTAALSDSEHMLRDVLTTSSDWLWEMGPDLRFTHFSARAEEVLGIDPALLVGKTRTVLAEEDTEREKWVAHLAQLERREPFRDFTYLCRLPNGLRRHLRISGVPVFGADGAFEGYRGIASDVTAAVDQQHDLERTTGILQSTLANMEQGLAVFDSFMRVTAFNERFGELFFLPEGWFQIGSTTFSDLIRLAIGRGYYGDVNADEVVAGFEADVAQRVRHRFERRIPDGRWLQINRNPMPDGGFVITVTDVTALKGAEEGERAARAEANRARQQLLDAIEAIDDGFTLWDADDRLVLMNRVYRESFSYAPELLVPGRPFAEVIAAVAEQGRVPKGYTPDSWMVHRLDRHRSPGPPYVIELHDGRVVRITDQRTQDGGLVSVRTDVTELARRQREVETSRRLLRAVIDAVPAIINVKDEESRYVLMNRFQGEVYGVDPDQAIGHTSAEYSGATYGRGSRELDLQVLRSGQPQPFMERDFVDVHGQSHTWFTAKLPLKDPEGRVRNIVTVALDITALKRMERARANLARYFAPNMVNVLAEVDEPFGPARSQFVAVLFADIVGFTRLGEQLAPNRVFLLLRAIQQRLAALVFECRGTLDKYIGDGVMATFGTPFPSQADPRNALRCARRMQAAIDTWNAEREGSGEPVIRLGVGVHFGPALLGNIGTENRLEFAVIGDTVNVANRLERMCRDLDVAIVVSDPLVQAVREEAGPACPELAGLMARGPHAIRGRVAPMDLWTLG